MLNRRVFGRAHFGRFLDLSDLPTGFARLEGLERITSKISDDIPLSTFDFRKINSEKWGKCTNCWQTKIYLVGIGCC